MRFAIVQLIFYSSTILLSFLIGYAAERSRSVVVAVSIHAYADVFTAKPDLYVPLLLVLLVWVFLLVIWPKQADSGKAAQP